MITVFKYTIPADDTIAVLPREADILTVAFQGDDLCVWAKVDTSIEEMEARTFKVFGTGSPIPQDNEPMYNFIGTAFMNNGLVFHVFELEY